MGDDEVTNAGSFLRLVGGTRQAPLSQIKLVQGWIPWENLFSPQNVPAELTPRRHLGAVIKQNVSDTICGEPTPGC